MARNPNKKRCTATNRKGERCGNWAVKGYDVCYYHGARGGAPKKNKNAEKHGLRAKYIPKETMEIADSIKESNPIDILWENITLQYAAIIRAQKIMYVTDKEEMIKELKKSKYEAVPVDDKSKQTTTEEEYEFQFAWDRQATFLKAQSRAMGELRSMIKQYDDLCKTELATEEQKARIEKLKADTNRILGVSEEIEDLSNIYKEIYGDDIDDD